MKKKKQRERLSIEKQHKYMRAEKRMIYPLREWYVKWLEQIMTGEVQLRRDFVPKFNPKG